MQPYLSRHFSRRGLLLRAAAFGLSAPAGEGLAASGIHLSAVASGDYPPLNMERPDGSIGGVYADVLRIIAERLGWAYSYRPYPWARAQEMVRRGQADAYITVPTPERVEYMKFTSTPLIVLERGLLVTHRDHPLRRQIEAIDRYDALREVSIAAYIGDGWAQRLWKDWPNVQWARDLGSSVRLLARRQVALLVQPRELVQHQARKLDATDLFVYRKVDFIPDPINAFHFGVRRTFPDSDAVVAAFEREQERLRGEGFLKRLIVAYM